MLRGRHIVSTHRVFVTGICDNEHKRLFLKFYSEMQWIDLKFEKRNINIHNNEVYINLNI